MTGTFTWENLNFTTKLASASMRPIWLLIGVGVLLAILTLAAGSVLDRMHDRYGDTYSYLRTGRILTMLTATLLLAAALVLLSVNAHAVVTSHATTVGDYVKTEAQLSALDCGDLNYTHEPPKDGAYECSWSDKDGDHEGKLVSRGNQWRLKYGLCEISG